MSLNAVKMLGISFTISPKDKILEYLEKGLENQSAKQKKSIVIVTPNPEQIVYAQSDSHFAEILNQADVAIPDGIGLAVASRFLKLETRNSKLERIPGVEFMEDLVGLAAKRGYPVALIGGRAGVAVEALECLFRRAGLTGWAMELPEIQIGDLGNISNLGYLRKITEKIHESGTRLVFVGLGAPKQEYFIARLVRNMSFRPSLPQRRLGSRNPEKKGWIPGQARDDNKNVVFMSVGGSFDIISGRTPRAPSFVRTVGLEWFWRLVREPWRWKRQLALVKFFWLVICKKLASKG